MYGPTQQAINPVDVTAQGKRLESPIRETEVQRELGETQILVQQLSQISEELTKKLTSVISPKNDGEEAISADSEASVSTPLGTNIRDLNIGLKSTRRTLNFILNGLEL